MLPRTPARHQSTDPPTETPLTTPSSHHTALSLHPSAPLIDDTARDGTQPDKATCAPSTARRRTGAASDPPTHLPRTCIPNIDTTTDTTATKSSTPSKPASPASPAPATSRTRSTRDEAAYAAARDAAHVARATARATRQREGHCVVGFGTGEGVGVGLGVSGPRGRP